MTDGLLAEVDVALLKAQPAIQDAEDFLVRARKQLQQLQDKFSQERNKRSTYPDISGVSGWNLWCDFETFTIFTCNFFFIPVTYKLSLFGTFCIPNLGLTK